MSLSKFLKESSSGVLIPALRQFLLEEEASSVTDADIQITDAKMTIEWAKERIQDYSSKDKENNPYKDYFHPSSIGGCLRAMWYHKMRAFQDPVDMTEDRLRRYTIFQIGTLYHLSFQNLCERAGFLIQREAPIIDNKERVIGHSDGRLKLPSEDRQRMLELKTINSRGFASLGSSPQDSHKKQATVYLHNLGLSVASIVYINKDTGEPREFTVEYDPDFYRHQCLTRIRKFHSSLKNRKEPDREGTNPRAFPCSFCAFTKVCFETKSNKEFLASLKKGTKNEVSKGKAVKEVAGKVKAEKPKKVGRKLRISKSVSKA